MPDLLMTIVELITRCAPACSAGAPIVIPEFDF